MKAESSDLRTVCKSMYIGAFISTLSASIVGIMFILVSYIGYLTYHDCRFHSRLALDFSNYTL